MRHGYRKVGRLVARLHAAQDEERLSVTELAGRLGVSPSTVYMLYGGWRTPGPKVLRGMLQAFPGLVQEVHVFLLDRMMNSEFANPFQ